MSLLNYIFRNKPKNTAMLAKERLQIIVSHERRTDNNSDFLPKLHFPSLENINFDLRKNNEIVQQGTTSMMLWNIDEIVSYVSQFFTLKKGDIIFTGTPKGVAAVKENDVLEGFLEGKQMFKIQVK